MGCYNNSIKKHNNYFGYIYIFIACAFILYNMILPAKEVIGSCQIVGSYMKRNVTCDGNYSEYTIKQAQAKATECNTNSSPVSGCDDNNTYYSYSDGSESDTLSTYIFIVIGLFLFYSGPNAFKHLFGKVNNKNNKHITNKVQNLKINANTSNNKELVTVTPKMERKAKYTYNYNNINATIEYIRENLFEHKVLEKTIEDDLYAVSSKDNLHKFCLKHKNVLSSISTLKKIVDDMIFWEEEEQNRKGYYKIIYIGNKFITYQTARGIKGTVGLNVDIKNGFAHLKNK